VKKNQGTNSIWNIATCAKRKGHKYVFPCAFIKKKNL
jgi:hypothetical protein